MPSDQIPSGSHNQNPYYEVTTIRDPNNFFGRIQLLKNLYSAILNRQCISLIGTRHVGKSSVLEHIQSPELQKQARYDFHHFLFLSIDIGAYLQKTAESFFDVLNQRIITQSNGKLELAPPVQEGADGFSDLLDQINKQRFYTVLLIDEFDNVIQNNHFDFTFFTLLRALANEGKVSYIIASTEPLYPILHRHAEGSPFFNIFATYSLGPLTLDEARDLITIPAHRTGLTFKEAERDWILTLAGRHPFFINRVCYYLFEEKSHQKIAQTTQEERNQIIERVYNDLLPHFDDQWRRLSTEEQDILKDEVLRKSNVQRKLPELSESKLFRKFVRDKCQLQLFDITVEDMQNILKKIDDMSFLGESRLTYWNITSMRIRSNTIVSAAERGKAVREVLNETFERLRGNGFRSDSAGDWRLYNILYYRYFKYHLDNQQIAARLGIKSTRQYFREQKRAIEVLLDTLSTMETALVYKEENGDTTD